MKYYNYRNSQGRFTRRVARKSNGKFASPIVCGRLYNYRGATVRAREYDGSSKAWLVSFHKTLYGFVSPSELSKINAKKVKKYLEAA